MHAYWSVEKEMATHSSVLAWEIPWAKRSLAGYRSWGHKESDKDWSVRKKKWLCEHSPRARHPGMWSQVDLRKHHYEQSYWRWWNSSWAISNPKRWFCQSAALNMPAHLETPAVATGLEKVSFHSNPKERQCQRMLKLPHNCTHLTY